MTLERRLVELLDALAVIRDVDGGAAARGRAAGDDCHLARALELAWAGARCAPGLQAQSTERPRRAKAGPGYSRRLTQQEEKLHGYVPLSFLVESAAGPFAAEVRSRRPERFRSAAGPH